MKVKVKSENVGLKLNIQKTKIMASGPITSWEIDGETVETVSDFIFLGSKIIADGDCSHEIKRHLLLGRKVMTNLDSIFKRIDAFELWCWRRLLRVLWTARKSNESILKEISPGCSLEGLMLKLKDWCWCWERLRAGGEGDDRGWDDWMVSPTRWTWVWVDSGSWWWTGRPGMLRVHGVAKNWTRLSDWTERIYFYNRAEMEALN